MGRQPEDLADAYRYNVKQIAEDIANQVGAEVRAIFAVPAYCDNCGLNREEVMEFGQASDPVCCVSRAGVDELAAIIMGGAEVEIQGESLLDERLRRARLDTRVGWAGNAPLTDVWLSQYDVHYEEAVSMIRLRLIEDGTNA